MKSEMRYDFKEANEGTDTAKHVLLKTKRGLHVAGRFVRFFLCTVRHSTRLKTENYLLDTLRICT